MISAVSVSSIMNMIDVLTNKFSFCPIFEVPHGTNREFDRSDSNFDPSVFWAATFADFALSND